MRPSYEIAELVQPAALATDGAGTASAFTYQVGSLDLTDSMVLLSFKIDGVAHAAQVELVLGDGGLAQAFHLRLDLTSITDRAWVAVTVPWAWVRITGRPDRAHITDVQLRVIDDGAAPVRVELARIAVVDDRPLPPRRDFADYRYEVHAPCIREPWPAVNSNMQASSV